MLEQHDFVTLREFRQRVEMLLQALRIRNEALNHVGPRLLLTTDSEDDQIQGFIPDGSAEHADGLPVGERLRLLRVEVQLLRSHSGAHFPRSSSGPKRSYPFCERGHKSARRGCMW